MMHGQKNIKKAKCLPCVCPVYRPQH